jgi:hypothetical protein
VVIIRILDGGVVFFRRTDLIIGSVFVAVLRKGRFQTAGTVNCEFKMKEWATLSAV